MKKTILVLGLLAGLFFVRDAQATLIDRGSGLIYDTVLDITWVQDANLCVTLGNCVSSITGAMTWDDANAWATNLIYQGFDDWRLPTTTQPDPTCSNQLSVGGFPDQGFGSNCTGSEMGDMYYNNLGGTAGDNLISNQGLFTSVGSHYWSGTEFAPNPVAAWFFVFGDGGQTGVNKDVAFFAWAVRDGDVLSVPEPGSVLLFWGGSWGWAWHVGGVGDLVI
jgi:hypothetical protein